MDTEFFSLPVSMLRQFGFCRRIPFFITLKNLNPPRGQWVNLGISMHESVERLMKRRDLSRLGINLDYQLRLEVSLSDQELGLHGVCDAVLESNDKVIPIEIKTGTTADVSLSEQIQTAAYAMLLEKAHGTSIDYGFVLTNLGRSQHVICIDEQLRTKVISTRDCIRQDICLGLMPPTSATKAKCCQCEFSNFCADRF